MNNKEPLIGVSTRDELVDVEEKKCESVVKKNFEKKNKKLPENLC